MKLIEEKPIVVQPNVMQRANGGYLAVSPESANIRIGVTANSEAEAVAEFEVAINRWMGYLTESEHSES